MSKKIAVKKLTASDLTFFVWHFRNRNAGNQKAINLNADVFIDLLYPSLPETEQAKLGRIPIDLYVYGPGLEGELNIQRKIVKTPSYKNWRLNGEFVDDVNNPERFSPLGEGDFVVIEFTGELFPQSARAFFVSRVVPEDVALHSVFVNHLGGNRMMALDSEEIVALIKRSDISANHPVNELTLDDALEDVALGGSVGVAKLLTRRSGQKLTKEQLIVARQRAEEVGYLGEAYVNRYLADLKAQGFIQHFEWVSEGNAVAPHDFRVIYEDSEVLVDAKATTGAFERPIHVSMSELLEMSQAAHRYDIYRLFNMSDSKADLRIATDTREFASIVLRSLNSLPPGVVADAVSVQPEFFNFTDAISLSMGNQEEG